MCARESSFGWQTTTAPAGTFDKNSVHLNSVSCARRLSRAPVIVNAQKPGASLGVFLRLRVMMGSSARSDKGTSRIFANRCFFPEAMAQVYSVVSLAYI
jgi:hypothetical protein